MQAMKSEVQQCKKELADERGWISKLLEKNVELKLEQAIHVKCHYQAEETQCWAEKERKEMEGRLAKVIEDRAFTEELIFVEQERSDDLSKELHVLQEQKRTTEKIWFEEVSRLRGQLLF